MPKTKPRPKTKRSKPAAAPSLDHLYVATGNFEAAWKFWTGVIGLPVRHQWGDGDHQAGALAFGSATVVIAQEPPSVRTEFGYATDHGRPQIFVRADDIEKTYAAVQKRGGRIVRALAKTHWGPRAFSVEAPDGLYVCFIEPIA